MRSELVKCNICGDTYDAKVPRPWHSITVHCTIKVPEDGVNGGNFSGDWCEGCRIKFNNKMRELKEEIRSERETEVNKCF